MADLAPVGLAASGAAVVGTLLGELGGSETSRTIGRVMAGVGGNLAGVVGFMPQTAPTTFLGQRPGTDVLADLGTVVRRNLVPAGIAATAGIGTFLAARLLDPPADTFVRVIGAALVGGGFLLLFRRPMVASLGSGGTYLGQHGLRETIADTAQLAADITSTATQPGVLIPVVGGAAAGTLALLFAPEGAPRLIGGLAGAGLITFGIVRFVQRLGIRRRQTAPGPTTIPMSIRSNNQLTADARNILGPEPTQLGAVRNVILMGRCLATARTQGRPSSDCGISSTVAALVQQARARITTEGVRRAFARTDTEARLDIINAPDKIVQAKDIRFLDRACRQGTAAGARVPSLCEAIRARFTPAILQRALTAPDLTPVPSRASRVAA